MTDPLSAEEAWTRLLCACTHTEPRRTYVTQGQCFACFSAIVKGIELRVWRSAAMAECSRCRLLGDPTDEGSGGVRFWTHSQWPCEAQQIRSKIAVLEGK